MKSKSELQNEAAELVMLRQIRDFREVKTRKYRKDLVERLGLTGMSHPDTLMRLSALAVYGNGGRGFWRADAVSHLEFADYMRRKALDAMHPPSIAKSLARLPLSILVSAAETPELFGAI